MCEAEKFRLNSFGNVGLQVPMDFIEDYCSGRHFAETFNSPTGRFSKEVSTVFGSQQELGSRTLLMEGSEDSVRLLKKKTC